MGKDIREDKEGKKWNKERRMKKIKRVEIGIEGLKEIDMIERGEDVFGEGIENIGRSEENEKMELGFEIDVMEDGRNGESCIKGIMMDWSRKVEVRIKIVRRWGEVERKEKEKK